MDLQAREETKIGAQIIGWGGLLALACAFFALGLQAADTLSTQAFVQQTVRASGVKGGLLVHLGCGDGQRTAALAAVGSFIVQGLDPSADNIREARDLFRSKGVHGNVTARQWSSDLLPYADNVVNLLVVEKPGEGSRDEWMRVLCPNGVVCIRQGKTWRTVTKPRPAEIDEWTHYLHSAGNNAVAHDTVVGPPRHIQWIGGPAYARHHERFASISAVVSAGGRVFYIADEGLPASILFPAKWSLIARDAFSGVLLWKRPMESWAPHLWAFFAGPPEIARRLVAVGDRVYVTLGYPSPIVALDAATGDTVMTYRETENTEEVLLDNGILFLVTGDEAATPPKPAKNRRWSVVRTPEKSRGLVALDPATGTVLWRKPNAGIYAMTPAVNRGRVFYQTPDGLVCLDAKTGAELWQAPRPSPPSRPTWSAPTLVAYGKVVLSVDRDANVAPPPRGSRVHSPQWSRYNTGGPGKLIAFAAATGKQLWSCKSYDTHRAPGDVFVSDGLVWVGSSKIRNTEDFTVGRDPLTGEVRRTISTAKAFASVHHHRCYRNKATDKFILLARTGTEFIDVKEGNTWRNNWVRGECQYGIMPCNGLLYAPPHPCACYVQAKLNGFMAMAPARATESQRKPGPQLVAGPAISDIPNTTAGLDEWATFRSDATRSGRAGTRVSAASLKTAWRTEIGGRLSSPVMAEGRVLVTSIDDHSVHALDAADGKPLWQFTTGARIDSPPTIHKGRAVFGCRDGWVYCLRMTDGALAWRFRAAPDERHIVAEDQLESAWPVHGSILVQDDVAYCVAGRSSFLDGGLHFYALDMRTGKLLQQQRIVGKEAGKGEAEHKEWVHVALTWDGAVAQGYLDGRAQRTSCNEVKGGRKYTGLRVGYKLDRSFFEGPIDNVRIYRRALSKSEIQALHDTEKTVPVPVANDILDSLTKGLVLHLAFDEGTGAIAHDGSGLGNDGKLNGARWVSNGDGHALRFNGEDAWLDCGKAEALNISGPITLSVWIRPERLPRGAKGAAIVLASGTMHWNSPYCLSVRHKSFSVNLNDAQTRKRHMISWRPAGSGLEMAGGLPDILSCSGDTIYLRELAFDRKTLMPREDAERHLFGSDGFVSDSWWHRAYWIYGTDFQSGAAGWYKSGRRFPAGKILAMDSSTVYGYGMKPDNYRWSTPLGYQLFAASKDAGAAPITDRRGVSRPGALPSTKFARAWDRELPIHGRALVVTDEVLFVAGPPVLMNEHKVYGQLRSGAPAPQQLLDAEAAFMGRKGGSLFAVKLGDGTTIKEYSLPSPPVFDGLIAARKRLYLAAMDGTVTCFGP
ncbi:MAG: PQQ-binding-like beta-propeller repeat protein [Lentisphaeria bacterium]|nr:PQQ-binding-like beta-propeller repeat protein [Lentisphaeria bacterium]